MKLLVCVLHSDKHRFGDWLSVSDAEAEALLGMMTAGRPFYELLRDLGPDEAVAKAPAAEDKPVVVEEAPAEVPAEPVEEKAEEPAPEPVKADGRKKRAAN